MAQSSGPWTGGAVGNADWRAMRQTLDFNGIVNDAVGTGLRVTAAGNSTEVKIGAGAAILQGALYLNDDDVLLDLDDVGTLPSSTQTRIDIVILRYDADQVNAEDRVKLAILPGAPATSGAVSPALTRTLDGIWEEPLAVVTRKGDVAVVNSMIFGVRRWRAPVLFAETGVTLPNAYVPYGTVVVRRDDILARVVNDNVAQWQSVLNPPWTNLTLAGGYASDDGIPPKYRVFSGHLELRGHIKRSNGATLLTGSYIVIASVPDAIAAGINATNYPRVLTQAASSTVFARVQLATSGLIKVYLSGAVDRVDLDGVRLPLP